MAADKCIYVHTLKFDDHLFIINVTKQIIPKLCTGEVIFTKKVNFIFDNCGIEELETNLFENYKVGTLILENNKIKTLYSYTFSKIDIINLHLINNSIEFIENNAFFQLHQLEVLYLSYNNIKTLKSSYFDKMPKLIKFYVDHNKIIKITQDTFLGVVNIDCLQFIHLEFNEIEDIETDSFKNMQLKELDLSNNLILTLDENSFTNSIIDMFYLKHVNYSIYLKLCFNKFKVNTIVTNCLSGHTCRTAGKMCSSKRNYLQFLIIPAILMCILFTAIVSTC